MRIDVYSITNPILAGALVLFNPTTSACVAIDSFNTYQFATAFSSLLLAKFTYFIPDVDGNYITTLDINSSDDFYNYPELFI